MFAHMPLERGVQLVRVDLELGRHHRHHPGRPVHPGSALVARKLEHLRHGFGPINQLTLHPLQADPALLRLQHLVRGPRLHESHPAGRDRLAALTERVPDRTNRRLRHRLHRNPDRPGPSLTPCWRSALLARIGVRRPSCLDLRQVPRAISLSSDPPGLLGPAHRRLAHPDPARKLTVAGRPPIHTQTRKSSIRSLIRSAFLLASSAERSVHRLIKVADAETKMSPRIQKQIAKSREKALAAFVSKKAEIDAMLTRLQALSADHFNYSPDEVTWDHVGTLGYYAEMLKRVTDGAFKEGECAE
jgi:hypothetical protein